MVYVNYLDVSLIVSFTTDDDYYYVTHVEAN